MGNNGKHISMEEAKTRRAEIYLMRAQGASFDKIGEVFEISSGRARQIDHETSWRIRRAWEAFEARYEHEKGCLLCQSRMRSN